MADADRDAYLAGLTPGTDIDHRGTPFTASLLASLLDAVRDPTTGHPHLGVTRFGSATFQELAWFESVTFEGAGFESVTFEGAASFASATFHFGAAFRQTTFQESAVFTSATFPGSAWFMLATFQKGVAFRSVTFRGNAEFLSATFEGKALFESATFQGNAEFRSATFQDNAWFDSATFQSGADFRLATFERKALFESATFQSGADFRSATFASNAWFESAIFQSGAGFRSATFRGSARFASTAFGGHAAFDSATFEGDVWFTSATFERDVVFWRAAFERSVSLGPLVCGGRVRLSGAVFSGPVTLSIAALRLECRRTRWLSTAALRLRYATVDFAHAVFEYPLTITAEATPFVLADGRTVAEQVLADVVDTRVRIASLRGVDAAHLVLADVDLSWCLFTGTVHLDQLRLEGTCSFDAVPSRIQWRRWRPVWFTQRRTLAEEHHWRASQRTAVRGWNVAVLGAGHVGPAQMAPVYRALRKAFEDGKNEPGAADFYYGEMEMRRHDRTGTSRAERGLLHGYWMLSGYGLRASRALGWLAAAMLITIMLLMGFGLPKGSPKQEVTGTVPPGGGKVTFEIDKADPQNPTGHRFTGERFEKALNVTLNSVVFRSSGQDLTTAGTYIEMTSRVTEPALLGLAVLAVRNRVKR
ncbi:pentapeptide repeat-containing protein [Streptomyces canus]|uniref:pentapeptide repeat-containing protein n=1 Tax=Streptomyces canus TaxID=58343 RepID=UPI00386AC3D8